MPMVTPRTFEFGFAWPANTAGAPTIRAAGIAASAIRPSSRLVYRMTVTPSGDEDDGCRYRCTRPDASPAAEAIDLGHRHAVEVAGNRLLERARGDGEAQRVASAMRPVTSP